MTDLVQLESQILAAIEGAKDMTALEDARVASLGKKGAITELLKSLGTVPADQRKARGAEFNALRDKVTAALTEKKTRLEGASLHQKLMSEHVDVTLPALAAPTGTIHPVSHVMEEI